MTRSKTAATSSSSASLQRHSKTSRKNGWPRKPPVPQSNLVDPFREIERHIEYVMSRIGRDKSTALLYETAYEAREKIRDAGDIFAKMKEQHRDH